MTSSDALPEPALPTEAKTSTVLIIQENPEVREDLSQAIGQLGFSHVTAKEKPPAAESLIQHKILCFICAYTSQNVQGLHFLVQIRRQEKFAYTPFFLTDSFFTTMKVMKAGHAGATGLLVIPFTLQTLREKLTRCIDRAKSPLVDYSEQQVNKGSALIDAGRYNEGIILLKSIIDQKNGPEYYFNIGYILSKQKKYPEAIEAFKKATQLDRLFAKAYEAMSRAYRAMGEKSLADQYMGYAAEIHMERENYGHAEEILEEMMALGSDSLNVFNSLGIIYRKKGDHKTAIRHYARALKIHPDEPNIYYNMGRICLDMKEVEKAREFFKKAIHIKNDFKEAHQILKAMDLGIL